MKATKPYVESKKSDVKESICEEIVNARNDNSLQSSPLVESLNYKRCRKGVILNGTPSSLLHKSLKHLNGSANVANSQGKMGSPLYLRDLKEASLNHDAAAYYAVLGEYYVLDCTPEEEAKHYALAFYVAEHYGCREIKKHIYGVISQLLRSRLKKELVTLSHMLHYKKEFHKIYPQLIALLQVHINDAITSSNFRRVEEIYLQEVPFKLLSKNFTYLVEMPARFARQISKSYLDKNESASRIYLFMTSLKSKLLISG